MHAPRAVLVFAHLLAVVGGLLSLCVRLYYGGTLTRRSVAITPFVAAMTWALSLGSVAWGVTVLWLFAASWSAARG